MKKIVKIKESQLVGIVKKIIKEVNITPDTSKEYGYDLDDFSERHYSSENKGDKSTVSDAMLMKAQNIEKNLERLGARANVSVNNEMSYTGSLYSSTSTTKAVFTVLLSTTKVDPKVYSYLGKLGASIVDLEDSYSKGEAWSSGSVTLKFSEEIDYDYSYKDDNLHTGRKDNRTTPRGKNELNY